MGLAHDVGLYLRASAKSLFFKGGGDWFCVVAHAFDCEGCLKQNCADNDVGDLPVNAERLPEPEKKQKTGSATTRITASEKDAVGFFRFRVWAFGFGFEVGYYFSDADGEVNFVRVLA